MRAHFDAALIADLKRQVSTHNEANPGAPVKLADLKKVYERHYRRSANPGQRAMEKVSEHLAGLAKADEFDETQHPRGRGGEFSPKGGSSAPRTVAERALPAKDSDHRALQQSNAGYRATTSEVIPEQRYGAAGAALRDVGSLAAGAGVVGALARNKPGGFAERAAAKVAGTATGIAGGAGAAVAANTARATSIAARKILRVTPVLSADKVNALRQRGSKAGRAVGAAIGRYSVRGTSAVVQGALKTAGNGPMHEKAVARTGQVMRSLSTKGVNPASVASQAAAAGMRLDRRIKFGRKAALFGVLAGATGLAIRSQIKDTMFDPANIGHSFDAFSYRTVQKMAASPEIEAARQHLVGQLAKDMGNAGSIESLSAWLTAGGAGDRLAKGVPWGRGITTLLTGGAAAAGAAIGSGLGFGAGRAVGINGKKGNPYRDKSGKFTSRDKAVTGVGAVLGGLGAGLAVYAALKGHNRKVWQAGYDAIKAQGTRILGQIDAGNSRRVKALLNGKARHVLDIMDEHPDLQPFRDSRAALQASKASAVAPLQAKLRDIYHTHIATQLAGLAEHVKLPQHKGKTLAEQFPNARTPVGQTSILQSRADAVRDALLNTDEAGLKAMLPGFSDKHADDVVATFTKGKHAVAGVEAVIAAHHTNIKAAKADVDQAKALLDQARKAYDDANIAHGLADDANKATTQATLDKASKARDRIDKLHEGKVAALDKLRANPKGIDHPFIPNTPIPPPTDKEWQAIELAEHRAHVQAAEKIFDKKVADLKHEDTVRATEGLNLSLAAHSMSGAKYGSSKHIQKSVKAIAAAAQDVEQLGEKLTAARLAHMPNAADFADLQRAANLKGAPKGMKLQRAKDVRARAAAIRTAHATTADALATAEAAHSTAAADLVGKLTVLRTAMSEAAEAAPKKTGRKLFSDELRGDLKRMADLVGGKAGEVVRSKTEKSLSELAADLKAKARQQAKVGVGGAKKAGRAVVDELFTRPDGKGGREFSARATGRTVAVTVPAALAGAATAYEIGQGLKNKDTRKETLKRIKRDALRHVEHVEDPISGAGYTAVTAPHPKIKGERILVWGEGQLPDGKPFKLNPGSSMADVTTKMKQRIDQAQQQKQQRAQKGGGSTRNADLPLSQEHAKAVSERIGALQKENQFVSVDVPGEGAMRFRHPGDSSGNNEAGHVINAIRQKADTAAPAGDKLHAALGALFSPQSQAMQAKQAYRFLTDQDEAGKTLGKHKAIFGDVEGFRSADKGKVATSVHAEVTRMLDKSPPGTPAQKANLARMVALVGHVKGLSAEQLKPSYDKIAAATVKEHSAASSSAATPAAEPGKAVVPLSEDVKAKLSTAPSVDGQYDWKRGVTDHGEEAQAVASHMMDKLGLDRAMHAEVLPGLAGAMARKVFDEYKLSIPDSFKVVHRAFDQMIGTHRDPQDVRRALFGDKGFSKSIEFMSALNTQAMKLQHQQREVEKTVLLDDLEALMKASFGEFEESLHPRAPSGAQGGGEFVAGAGGHGGVVGRQSPGQRLATEGVEGASKQASGGGGHAAAAAGQAWNHPVRIGNELGGQLGYETAYNLARQFLPSSVKGVVRLGGELLAGQAGSAVGSAAGDAIGQRVVGGKRHVAYQEPESRGLGETGASLGGSIGGSFAGETAGAWAGGALGSLAGPAGTVAGSFAGRIVGGAIGGYAGDLISRGIFAHYADRNQPAVGLTAGLGIGAAGYAASNVDGVKQGAQAVANRASGVARHFAGFDSGAATRALSRFGMGVR